MKQWIVLLVVVFCVSSAFAGADVQSKKMAEVTAQDELEAWTLTEMTCTDVFDLFDDATPGDKKDAEEVMAAQDDVLDLITWVHGYLSGRDGLKKTKYTMNKAGINLAIADIVTVCKPDEEELFLDVVPQIK